MSTSENHITQDELDRLWGGDLSQDETALLLAKLDSSDDGWRRCALALLEANSWRRAFEGVAGQEQMDDHTAVATVRAPAARSRAMSRWAMIAGALVVAFVGGLSAGRMPTAKQSRPPEHIAESAPPVSGNQQPPSSDAPDTGMPDAAVPPGRIVGTVCVEDDAEVVSTAPIVQAGSGLDERMLAANRREVPSLLKRQFETRGWRIESDRQLIHVQLEDGQEMTIPIDSMHYRFVGRKIY